MSIDQELQKLQEAHLRDLENSALRERLRQLYLRSGREVPQSLARRSINLDRLIAALEHGGRLAGLNDLLRQGLTSLNSWHFLNDLLLDSDYPDLEDQSVELFAIGPVTSETIRAMNLRVHSKIRDSVTDSFASLIASPIHGVDSWLLLEAFDESLVMTRSQSLKRPVQWNASLLPFLTEYEHNQILIAIALGFEFVFARSRPSEFELAMEILAVGPYSKDLECSLYQGPTDYQAMSPESVVVEKLFACPDELGDATHYEIMSALAVDPLDPSTYEVYLQRVDISALQEIAGLAETNRFEALSRHGFRFHFVNYR